MSQKHPIPAHEPRAIKSNLFAEAPAQGGILAPGGPSSGSIDRHPGEDRDPFAPVHHGQPSAPKRKRPSRPRPKRKRARAAKPAAPSAT